MQNLRRRPPSRRECNHLRVYEIQSKSLLTVNIGHKLLHATIRSIPTRTNRLIRSGKSTTSNISTSPPCNSLHPQLYTTKQARRPPVQITGSRRACFIAFLLYFAWYTISACFCAIRHSSAALKACACVIAFSVRFRLSRIKSPKNG